MTAPVTVDAARDRVRRVYSSKAREWAASGADGAVLDVPLHPPTERDALVDLDAARVWVADWRRCEVEESVTIDWQERAWPRVGSQSLPQRLHLHGADAIASFAGTQHGWVRLSSRLRALRDLIGEGSTAALKAHARSVDGVDDVDFGRLLDVLSWLRTHPVSGRRVRELPIRGVDTKWIEGRRAMLEALHGAATGSSGLGLHEPDPLVRMRILDPALAVGGLTDLSAPIGDLAALDFRPNRVFVFENLATVLAMPTFSGAVVLHGGGYRVDLVARLPWAHEVVYWGDLDSHGFAILHRLRSRGVAATSALMNSETALAHQDLWGVEPEPNTSPSPLLTSDESKALSLLSAAGNVRLEQERIPWDYALDALSSSLPRSKVTPPGTVPAERMIDE